MSDIESYYSPLTKEKRTGGRIFVITKDNKIIGLNVLDGETVCTSDLIENTQLFAPIVYAHTLWVVGNKGSVFVFPGSDSAGKVVKIPGSVFHTPGFTRNKIYITTEKMVFIL